MNFRNCKSNSTRLTQLLVGLVTVLAFSMKLFAQAPFTVFEKSINEIQEALGKGDVSSVELVDQYLARVAAYDKKGPHLNSIVRVNENARAQAAVLDEERKNSGARSMLHGIPILIKDNYNTSDIPTTGASVALANFVPNQNSTQVVKLLDAGAILIAKTNLHEFAYGITSVSSLVGQTRNPYDHRRVPGGSSGGTGAAVAASFGAAGMGSDTCGSIRIPSAYNNLYGLRPSKGLSSIFGIMPLSHTQDTGGPLARSLEDLAILLDLTVGYDPEDQATQVMESRPHPEFVKNLDTVRASDLRLGKIVSYFDNADGPTQAVTSEALNWYAEQGAEIVDVSIPNLPDLLSASRVIEHEFESDLNEYFEIFGSEEIDSLEKLFELGLFHEAISGRLYRTLEEEPSNENYMAALEARVILREALSLIFESQDLDALVYPTMGKIPVFTGEQQTGSNCSMAANSGLPALSMPAGFTEAGIPVGIEFLGKQFQDSQLLAIAQDFANSNNVRQPPSVTPPLVNGQSPSPEVVELVFNQSGIRLTADFSINRVTNLISYEIFVDPESVEGLFAVTLNIMSSEDEPSATVLNLVGPMTEQTSGDWFMSPELLTAFQEQQLYIRVFSDSLPVEGKAILLR